MLWMLAYPLSPLRETWGFGCCGIYGCTKRMFQSLLKGTLELNNLFENVVAARLSPESSSRDSGFWVLRREWLY